MYIFDQDISDLRSHIRREVEYKGDVDRTSNRALSKRVQEWLCLHNRQVVIDGDFGPVTEDAVASFQTDVGLNATGVVDEESHFALVGPMLLALEMQIDASIPFGEATLAFANAHLAQHPREVGGANRGPWVRLYMNGKDGPDWLWCAGFVTFCMKQAAEALEVSMPIKGSFSCDSLAAQAKEAGIFLSERSAEPEDITPGSIFLSRRTSFDWTHTGLVSDARDTLFKTIEGNTNDEGSRNGYEVCARSRGYSKKDFILL